MTMNSLASLASIYSDDLDVHLLKTQLLLLKVHFLERTTSSSSTATTTTPTTPGLVDIAQYT